MKHFLVVFDRAAGHVVRLTEFKNAKDALKARFALEAEENSNLEIVVLGASSEERIRKTHSSYFESADEAMNALSAIHGGQPLVAR